MPYAEIILSFIPSGHVRNLTPPWPAPPLIVNDLFITSGCACMKVRAGLIPELKALRQQLLAQPPTPENNHFGHDITAALAEAHTLLEFLTRTRGIHVHLECEWEEGQCHCKGKDPRGCGPPSKAALSKRASVARRLKREQDIENGILALVASKATTSM